MKKSLLALAVLGAFAGSAFAQASSVTIFGKIDAAVGKPIGTKDKQVIDNAAGPAGSRLGFRGYEDLGGGLGAVFAIEHRFNVDTGTAADTFWNGFSFVGLRSAQLGTLTIGRHYTSAFLGVQNVVDPFAGETIAGLRNIASGINAGVAPVRLANSLKYDFAASGFAASATVAEKVGGPDRPYSLSASYTGGPLWVGVAYDDLSGVNDDVANIGASYKFGPVLLSGMYSNGSTNTNAKVKGALLGANVNVGSGDIKVGYATLKIGSATQNKRIGVGYHHNLSKRTKLYADFARDSKVTTPAGDPEKTGYDFGIQHNF